VEGLTSEGRVEAIVMNASGCGVTVKEYGQALAHDPAYAEKARRIAALTRDVSELLHDLAPALQKVIRQARPAAGDGPVGRLAYHPPCTLQHGQKLRGGVEGLLRGLGFEVHLSSTESHLCCGSAGTYSVLQPELSEQLRDRKLAQLDPLPAEQIVSGNIGCIQHLGSGTPKPVRHWIEVVDEALN
jgi:glycolate oxidase iron-sulfur subunit